MKVEASFTQFHSSLCRMVLHNYRLMILGDDEFGDKIADCIYGVYLHVPLNLIENDEWLHRLLSRYAENDILRAIQTVEAMPSTYVGKEVYDQWRKFLEGCQCEDDSHIREKCPVHTLIRSVNDTCQAIESLRLRLRESA
jgi:hypothetical protein